MKTSALWLVWALVVFGALNVYSAPNPDMLGDPPAQAHPPGLANLLLVLRDEGDTRRYFAYASAILGRPYDGFYFLPGAAEATPAANAHAAVDPDRPLWPWRDFTVEYPPGMLVAALIPALFTHDFPTYHLLFSLFMGALLTASVALNASAAERIVSGAGRDTLMLSILFVAALGIVCVRRYDAVVALAISGAIFGMVAGRPALAGAGLGAGTIAKGTPLLLAPIGAILWLRERRGRELAIGAGVGAATIAIGALIYVFIAGAHALDAFAYHAERPLQIESPYGAALMLGDLVDPGLARKVMSFGSENVQSAWEPALRRLSSAVLAIALVAVLVWFWRAAGRATDRAARARALLAASTAMLIAFIGLGKVFSPQYLVWLLPSAVMAAALSSERSRVLLIAAAAMTQVEFPFVYFLNTPWVGQIIAAVALIRDALLIGAAVSLLADAPNLGARNVHD